MSLELAYPLSYSFGELLVFFLTASYVKKFGVSVWKFMLFGLVLTFSGVFAAFKITQLYRMCGIDIPGLESSMLGPVIVAYPMMILLSTFLRIDKNIVVGAAATFFPIGLALGRIGCYFVGCCGGNVWWVPVQFVAAIANLIIFAILFTRIRQGEPDDKQLMLFFILYGTKRVLLGFARTDEPVLAGVLTLSQWIAIGIAFAGLLAMILPRQAGTAKPRSRESS